MPAPTQRVDDLGFPLPGSFDDLPDQPSRKSGSWGKFFYRYRWGVLLLLLLVLFGDSLVTGARQFVAKRLLDGAEAHLYRDHLTEALTSVNRALFWEPDTFERWKEYSYRAEIYEEFPNHLTDSLDDLNEVISRLDDPARSKEFLTELTDTYRRRASVLERLGRHHEAIADCNTALKIGPSGARAMSLNERAYIRALANVELDEALQDVQQSIVLDPDDPEVIDTRGYVLFRLEKYSLALKDLDQAIRGETPPMGGFLFQGNNGAAQVVPLNEVPPRMRRKNREALAVMYHHHGEILKKLGQAAKGDEEIHHAERMGYDPKRGVY